MKKLHTDTILLPMLASVALIAYGSPVEARDYFDPGLLTLAGGELKDIDLSSFENADHIPPGSYLVTLVINQTDAGQHTVHFKADDNGKVQPELTPALLQELGVNVQGLPAFSNLPADEPVSDLTSLIPQSRIQFDFTQLRLALSIPQIAMQPDSQGNVDPAKWDHGIPALLLNYNLNGGRNWQDGQSGTGKSEQSSLFALLSGGINLDAWRLRSNMSWTRNTREQEGQSGSSEQHTQFSNTYLMRDIHALRAEILAGESSTSSDVFDSIPFRGMKLSSTDDMLPYNQRGFAPVVEGIAQSNARVTVSQNGNVIYQTYVAPGPFSFSNLNQTGQGGELTVTVTEADGTVHTQTQAIASLPVMRRAGSLKYELTAGRYDGGVTVGSRKAGFISGTAIYGLPWDITLYGGGLLAGDDYSSVAAGAGASLGPLGALSADVTTSSAKLHTQDNRQKGNSYRIRYAKNLLSTGSSVDLATYRYSTRNFYSFADFNNMGYQLNEDQAPWTLARQRSNVQLRLSQQLGGFGAVYLSAARNDYWGSKQVMNTLSAGYSSNYRGISYGLTYSVDRTKGDGNWPENKQLFFNVQVPLDLFSSSLSSANAYANYQATHDNRGRVQQQAGINGNVLDSRLSYSVMQGWSNNPQDKNTSTMNLGYQGSKGIANAGYSYSNTSRSLNMGASGAVIAHQDGVTLSQMLGNSVAIVSAPGAEGTHLTTGNAVTDSRGFAVMPYLSSYQANTISLNPSTLPDDVDITQSSTTLYPTKGAVVMAKFATKVGFQVLMTLQQRSGTPVPFGAIAAVNHEDKSDENTGIVGDAGQVYLSGLPEQGSLQVKWGQDASRQCRVTYNLKDLPAPSEHNPVRSLTARCE
ncbi:outer membrane usher protein [Serratia sp. PL17]|uniref:fimbria/pilus outer membrane usher protein n=1 Tax=Serratia sp. PL17 TaxID=2806582 RepID=UPI001AE35FDB|nr:fimbria/pilus outer membrane usher protein [Serratia sp. PL17]MBP1133082.1 outer membrane usher protein [Serratia sp. PL17]